MNEQLALAAREGNLHEQAEIQRLRDDGWKVDFPQYECHIEIIPGIAVIGHVDAANIEWPGDKDPPMFVEIKSMGSDTWKRFTREQWAMPGFVQKYKWQISAYMHAMGGRRCFFIAKNRNSGQTYTKIIERPFYTLDEIRQRVLTAESWAMRGELPPCDTDDKWTCPFPYLHEQAREEAVETERDEQVRDVCERIIEAQAIRDEADGTVRELKGVLRELLGNPEKLSRLLDDIQISVYYSRRTSYDYDKMKADGLDPDRYKIEDQYSAVRVSRKKKDKADADPETGRT